MTLVRTDFSGVVLVKPDLRTDDRGFLAHLYDAEELVGLGVDPSIAQSRVAFNHLAATLRGMHYQAAPFEETKIVRCTAGAVFDVVADLRPTSPTRHRWLAFELSGENRLSVVVPPGCAHGYMTLVPDTEVSYLISVPYVEHMQRGIRWDDPVLGILWPLPPSVVGQRDAGLPTLQP